jgi:hypothetical protein
MAQVRGTFPALYDNIDKVVHTILKDSLKENPPIFGQYYNSQSSDRKFERHQTVTPFGDVPEKPEGEVYSLDMIRPAYSKDFTHVEFGMGFEVTETAMEDDQYDQLNRSAEWLAFSARYVQEVRAAAPLNNGFTTEVTGNGQPLFDTAQPLAGGGTASNELNPGADLSFTSLSNAMIQSQTDTKIESGQLVAPIKGWILLVPPALEFLAYRIVNSAGLPGSADNDTNPLKALRSIKIVVNPHLTDTNAWFLIPAQKSMHGLLTYVRKPITQIPAAVDPYTGNKIVKVRFRQSWGAWMWQGLFASTGS